MTRSLAREVGEFGICVNAIAPGLVEHEGQTAPKALTELQLKARSIKRLQTPEDLLGTLVFLGSSDSDFMAQFLIAGRNYKTYEDLRGATFGTSSLSGGIITALKEALKLKGLEYPRDYKLLVIAGGSSANLAALQSGQIAATTVAVPLNYAAEESGLNIIGRLSEAVPQFQTNALVTRRAWAEKNRQLAIRFMKAMVLTFRWMFQNPDAAIDFLSKEMQLRPMHARRG